LFLGSTDAESVKTLKTVPNNVIYNEPVIPPKVSFEKPPLSVPSKHLHPPISNALNAMNA